MNDTNVKKKKSSKQKRVLIASIVLAGVIMVGSTFAWFTSKDEVTNKLTASNNYGVSIVEDFTPPSNWVPGQTVDKKVGVTNTGNIDAFVKLSLDDFLTIKTEATGIALVDENTGNLPNGTTIDGTKFASAIELHSDINHSTPTGTQSYSADEVTSLQAGGRLVYAPFYNNQKNNTDNDISALKDVHIINDRKDRIQGDTFNPRNYATGNKWEQNSTSNAWTYTAPSGIDTNLLNNDFPSGHIKDSVLPDDLTGLYVFERGIEATKESDGTYTYHYSYVGYYYNATTDKYYAVDLGNDGQPTTSPNTTNPITGNGVSYTVEHDNGATTITDDINTLITKVTAKLRQTATNTLKNTTSDTSASPSLKFGVVTDNTDTDRISDYYIPVTYSYQLNGVDKTITIRINLSNGYDTHWAYELLNGQPTFYYNYVLQAGKSVPDTEKPIISLTLDKNITADAYIDLDYNLNVILDSVQVVPENDGSIGSNYASAVNAQWAADRMQAIITTPPTLDSTGRVQVTWINS